MVKTKKESWVGTPKYWHKLVEIYSDKLKINRTLHLHVPLADALLKLGQTNEAIFALEDGLKVFPNSRSAKIMLAQISYSKRKYKIAKKILVEVVSCWPDAWAAVSLLCKIYDDEGNKKAALKISTALLDYMPDSTLAQDLKARYNEPAIEEIDPKTIPQLFDVPDSDLYYEHGEIPIFKKVKTMAKLETLLYRINLLKSEYSSSL